MEEPEPREIRQFKAYSHFSDGGRAEYDDKFQAGIS
jgi:hypothetical protein